jgi:DNA-binding MarR family transcriptional regulator
VAWSFVRPRERDAVTPEPVRDGSLGEAVQQLAKAQRARLAALLAPHGLHPGQDNLLVLLWSHPGLRQAELARRLGIEPPTVTRMVQRLERAGLVERQHDPHDARLVRVRATPRARMLEGVVRRAWEEVDTLLTDAVGEDGARDLRRLLLASADALTPRAASSEG